MPNTIEIHAKKSLDNSLEQLDEKIEQKLARIRQQALNQPTDSMFSFDFFQGRKLVAAFSIVAVTVLLSSYLFDFNMPSSVPSLLVQNEMVEDPDLLNDMEFIYWLSQENEQVLL